MHANDIWYSKPLSTTNYTRYYPPTTNCTHPKNNLQNVIPILSLSTFEMNINERITDHVALFLFIFIKKITRAGVFRIYFECVISVSNKWESFVTHNRVGAFVWSTCLKVSRVSIQCLKLKSSFVAFFFWKPHSLREKTKWINPSYY